MENCCLEINSWKHFVSTYCVLDRSDISSRLMRPNTPHFIITMSPSICFGSHFYCSSTLRDSCFGIYHCFVRGKHVTDREHPEHHRLLLYLLAFICKTMEGDEDYVQLCKSRQSIPHLPDIGCLEGLNDLFCLINLVEFGSIIFREHYSGLLSKEDTKSIGLSGYYAHRIVAWLEREVELVPRSPDANLQATVVLPMYRKRLLGQQARALHNHLLNTSGNPYDLPS